MLQHFANAFTKAVWWQRDINHARDFTTAEDRRRAAIVLGSEAEGLSPAWNGPQVAAIRLPMRGTTDSLNVSATAAVLFYEALRQRG